jgi:hypothetical protein
MKKIFLIGRRRTGIQTTIKALNILGYKKSQCLINKDSSIDLDISSIISEMKSLDICGLVRDYTLDEIRAIEAAYPDSTFILNKRASAIWYASFVRYFDSLKGEHPQSAHTNKGHYVTAYYEKYNTDIGVHFNGRAWKLFTLTLDGSHTWQGICAYLRKPIPSVSFPHENRSI